MRSRPSVCRPSAAITFGNNSSSTADATSMACFASIGGISSASCITSFLRLRMFKISSQSVLFQLARLKDGSKLLDHFVVKVRRLDYDSLLSAIWDLFAADTAGVPWRICPNDQNVFYPPRADRFYCTSAEQVAASKADYDRRRKRRRRQKSRG